MWLRDFFFCRPLVWSIKRKDVISGAGRVSVYSSGCVTKGQRLYVFCRCENSRVKEWMLGFGLGNHIGARKQQSPITHTDCFPTLSQTAGSQFDLLLERLHFPLLSTGRRCCAFTFATSSMRKDLVVWNQRWWQHLVEAALEFFRHSCESCNFSIIHAFYSKLDKIHDTSFQS